MRKFLIAVLLGAMFLSGTAFSAGEEFFASFLIDPRVKEVNLEPGATT